MQEHAASGGRRQVRNVARRDASNSAIAEIAVQPF